MENQPQPQQQTMTFTLTSQDFQIIMHMLANGLQNQIPPIACQQVSAKLQHQALQHQAKQQGKKNGAATGGGKKRAKQGKKKAPV